MPRVEEVTVVTSGTNVTITTTTEKVIISSGPVPQPSKDQKVMILGWVQVTTGAATTAVTPRIRRGTTITGTVVGDAVAEEIQAAAGSNQQHTILVSENRTNQASVEYSLTLEQTDATGNGTALQAGIMVVVL